MSVRSLYKIYKLCFETFFGRICYGLPQNPGKFPYRGTFLERTQRWSDEEYISYFCYYFFRLQDRDPVLSIRYICSQGCLGDYLKFQFSSQKEGRNIAIDLGLIKEARNTVSLVSEGYLDKKRQKYFNTERGLILCKSFGDIMYDEQKCVNCKYKKICIEN